MSESWHQKTKGHDIERELFELAVRQDALEIELDRIGHRPSWLTDNVLERLEEISKSADINVVPDDNGILEVAAIISSAGKTCLTARGWLMVKTFGSKDGTS